ncbi:MAG: hypothetical protein ACRDQT_12760 [Gaiellaceae bacterium]
MSADVIAQAPPSASIRLLADVRALDGRAVDERAPALVRLEEALGREFADRLVSALSERAAPAPHAPPRN